MNDLISRQAAIEQIDKWHDFYADSSLRTDKARRDELSAIKAMLINLPSLPPATPTERTGEWIITPEERTTNYIYTCSLCGWHEIHAYKDCRTHNYCPNCGAKMGGAE